MRISLGKSEIRGKVTVPSSKSYTIRGLVCAALAKGESRLVNPLLADDTEAAAEVLGKIGTVITREERLWRVKGGSFHPPETELFCRDSAATLRFMTALCALVPGPCRLTAGPSLMKRPVQPLLDALQQLGVKCAGNGGLPPVTVEGGKLEGGETEIAGDVSSQFISALLFIAPLAEKGIDIILTTPPTSLPYLRMTIECLAKFGIEVAETPSGFSVKKQTYQPAAYEVEGDWSSASYLFALGAACGEVTVTNLNPASLQGDRAMLGFLKKMGAGVRVDNGSVTARRGKLRALKADVSDCIDLLPTVAVLAALAEGSSELTGISRARLKESDRVAAVKEGLERLGISVKEEADKLTIHGGKPGPGEIDSWNDHRIAMAFSILGMAGGGITIKNVECVGKTFPEFWAILEDMGGRLTRDEQ